MTRYYFLINISSEALRTWQFAHVLTLLTLRWHWDNSILIQLVPTSHAQKVFFNTLQAQLTYAYNFLPYKSLLNSLLVPIIHLHSLPIVDYLMRTGLLMKRIEKVYRVIVSFTLTLSFLGRLGNNVRYRHPLPNQNTMP